MEIVTNSNLSVNVIINFKIKNNFTPQIIYFGLVPKPNLSTEYINVNEFIFARLKVIL